MKATPFYWEISKLLTGFCCAFDEVIIKRFNPDLSIEKQIQVRYVTVPKERVMYDIVNKAQNITLPVISVSLASLTRANDRVFNKNKGFYFTDSTNPLVSQFLKTPVPVDIAVNMSIITKFQTDMNQILSNFIPYNNPYIILSWQIPAEFGLSNDYEIRSEVLWNGSINLSYPVEQGATEKFHLVADTSFIIKGWLFPATNNDVKTIYYIKDNLYDKANITTFDQMSADNILSDIYQTITTNNNDELVLNDGTHIVSNQTILDNIPYDPYKQIPDTETVSFSGLSGFVVTEIY